MVSFVLEFRRDDTGQNKSSKCFGFVQSYDDTPKRRLFELRKSQGMQENQQVVFYRMAARTYATCSST